MNVFLEEILSQPQALLNSYEYMKGEAIHMKIHEFLWGKKIEKIVFTGMGSSYFCCFLPYYLLNSNGKNAEMREAGEFLLYTLPEIQEDFFKDQLIIMISQSGESAEIKELLIKIKSMRNPPPIIGITNDPESTLAELSDFSLLINAGREESVTSKSYVCTLLVLYMLSQHLFPSTLGVVYLDMNRTIEKIKEFLGEEDKINIFYNNLISFYGDKFESLEILARGPSLSTAYQAALNYKEIVKAYSEASPISTFRHGGIECLNNNSRLIIISSDETNFKLNAGFMKKIITEWEVGKILHITNRDFDEDEEILNNSSKIISFKHDINNPFLAPIMEIIILQLFFYKLAEKNNIVPGEFRFTQKITRDI